MPVLALQQVVLPPITAIDQPTLDAYLAIKDTLTSNAMRLHAILVTLNEARNLAAAQRDIMAQLVTAVPPSS